MNRREAMKKMVAAGVIVPVAAPVAAAPTGQLNGHTFSRQIELPDGVWDIFVKRELDTCVILHKETLTPYQSLKPIFLEKQIGRRKRDGEIRDFPAMIVPKQHVSCYNLEDIREHLVIVT